jgi:hypothetical protein
MLARGSQAIATAAVACGLAVAACGIASAAVPLPPELESLEQRGEALHVGSVRFRMSLDESFDLKLPQGHSFDFDLPVQAEGVARESPEAAVFRVDTLGQKTEVRAIGGATYVKRAAGPGSPEVAPKRTWKRESGVEGAGTDPLTLGTGITGEVSSEDGGGAGPPTASGNPVSGIASALASASSITQVGPEIVNGAQATEFAATLEPSALLGADFPKLQAAVEKMEGKNGGNVQITAQLDVFFAPDGLPVRTNWMVDAGVASITVSVDILATAVPVHVEAPPAAKTISATQLKKLEEAHRNRSGTIVGVSGHTKLRIPPPPSVKRAGGAELRDFDAGRSAAASAGCEACHQIGESGNPGPGPSLTHIGSRLSEPEIKKALIDPKAPMPSFKHLGAKKLHDLVRFLALLK